MLMMNEQQYISAATEGSALNLSLQLELPPNRKIKEARVDHEAHLAPRRRVCYVTPWKSIVRCVSLAN